MDDLLTQARKASRDPRECRITMDALRRIGFGDDEFRLLHQFRASFDGFYGYSKKVREFEEDGSNHRVHQRLMYILLSCPDSVPPRGKSFQGLPKPDVDKEIGIQIESHPRVARRVRAWLDNLEPQIISIEEARKRWAKNAKSRQTTLS